MQGSIIDRQANIVGDIIEGLHDADIVIADLTGKNQNVFYGLGARHILRRGTILITQSRKDVPFHLLTDRVICYSYPMDETEQAAFDRQLHGRIQAILRDPDAPDSPFSERLPFVGRTYARANLQLDMLIDKSDTSRSNEHVYTISLVMKNAGYKKIEDLECEIWWPARIPIVDRSRRMPPEAEDHTRPGYARFRNSANFGPLGPNRTFREVFASFKVNGSVYDSGELKKPVFLKVYADGEPPIEEQFELEESLEKRPGRKGVNF